MCDKLPYCARKVDPCIQKLVDKINKTWKGIFKTVCSCCGHGKYPTTVVVYNVIGKYYFEWFTKERVPHKGKKKLMFYTKDGKRKGDHYFLPTLMEL